MAASNQTKFVKDLAKNQIVVTHQCDADVETVWDMWTKEELLDQWWAPKPWRAETKEMNFTNGGRWFYAMVGPKGERHYSIADFSNIILHKSYNVRDGFSDENQMILKDMPQTDWKVEFSQNADGTKVTASLNGPGQQLQKLLDMGFEEGFRAALENLDEELASHTAKK